MTANSVLRTDEKSTFPPQGQTPRDSDIISKSDSTQSTSGGKDAANPKSEAGFPTGFRFFAIITALVLSIFLVALDTTIVSTAIPRITDEFHSLSDVGWYGSAFFLTVAAFQASWGKLYRYFPLKSVFAASVGVFELGSLICAVAQDSVTLIVGRAIAGLGGAGVASGTYTILAFSVPPSRRAAYTGIIGASFAVASFAGPLLGGAFTDHTTWRWCFWVNLPIGGVAAAVIVLFFKPPPFAAPQKASWRDIILQLDPLGITLLVGAVLCYLLAFQWGGVTKAWSHRDVVGTLVGFCVIIILFGINEYVLEERAMMPGRLFRNRTIVVCFAFMFLLSGSFFNILYYLPIYFQSVHGVSPASSGVRTLPLVLGNGVVATLAGAALGILGYYMPFMFLGGALTTVGSALLYTLEISSGSSKWIGYQALAGIGIGLTIQVPMIVNQASVDMADMSAISAITLLFQSLGGSVSVQAAQAAFSNKLLHKMRDGAPHLDPGLALSTGASELARVFDAADLPVVLDAYMGGLKDAFIIATALAGAAAVASFFVGWRSLKGGNGAKSNSVQA